MGAARILQPAAPHIWVPRIVAATPFTRRPAARNNRGRIPTRAAGGSAPLPSPPSSLVTSVPVVGCWVSNLVTQSGGPVTGWPDQSGNGNNLAQNSGSPTYTASDAAFGGQPSITFDGVDDDLLGSFAIPAAGTTPRHYWFVINQLGWTSGDCLFGSNAGLTQLVFQNGISPQCKQYSALVTAANGGAPIGTAKRGRALFTNSASDRLVLGSVSITGASAGNNTAANWFLGSASINFANFSIAVMLITAGAPNAGELTALDSWATALYGASILT